MQEQENLTQRPPEAGAASPAGAASHYAERSRYPERQAEQRDLGLAAALLLCCFLLWDCLLWAGGLGLGEALALAAVLPVSLVYLRPRPGSLRGYGLICAALYLLGALSLCLSGDGILKALTLPVLLLLYLIVLLERLGLRNGFGLRARVHDLASAAFSMTFGRLHAGRWALTHSGDPNSSSHHRRRAVLLGLVCAVPALFLLVPLLISSDAAFEGLVGGLDLSALWRGLLALGFGGFGALLLFTRLFTSDQGPRTRMQGAARGLEPAAVIAFLGAICCACVLYLVAQFAYFTDAFRGLLPKDFTVAEYARRGFFEMCGIVAINLGLLVAVRGLCRKQDGRLPGAVRALSLFLCLFSLGLVAAALSKMLLYMGSFGLTRLRVLTSAFMLLLAVILVAEGLRLFTARVPVAQLAVALGAAMLIGVSLANVDGLVARYNVDAWKSGKLNSLDMQTVCFLGDGATPVLAELAEDPDATVASKAQAELKLRSPETDWRSWNLITARSNRVLEARQEN